MRSGLSIRNEMGYRGNRGGMSTTHARLFVDMWLQVFVITVISYLNARGGSMKENKKFLDSFVYNSRIHGGLISVC